MTDETAVGVPAVTEPVGARTYHTGFVAEKAA
jgi:hypothetical protein